MSKPSRSAGPATHYALFAGLRRADVAYLVTGATALTLHGVPRLTPDVHLAVDPDPGNLARLERLLAAWGYGAPAAGPPADANAVVRRFRHPSAALDTIDCTLPTPDEFARLQAGAALVSLVDTGIPLVGAADLRALGERAGSAAGRDDAAGLEILAAVRAGETGSETDTRREQIRKFSRWSIAARCDWLLAAARLSKGLSPEAKPMTRGLVRRNPWTRGRR